MTMVFQGGAVALLAVILGLTLDRQGRDIGLLLTMMACTMLLIAAVICLQPVVDFLRQLYALGELNGEIVGLLFKIAGIGLLTEIISLICTDAGRVSLGKALQILSGGLILWLSIPIFTLLLELIQDILGEL